MERLELTTASTLDFNQVDLQPIEIDQTVSLARNILGFVLEYRRTPEAHSNCDSTCRLCQSPHLAKVIREVRNSQPVTFVLPAFPGKSPNLDKVLSPLPDMAERLALEFLQSLCDQIKAVYPPGAQMILCSDGRVFSDIVGMKESDVTAYQHELDLMIEQSGLQNISTFNLDSFADSENQDFTQLRIELMENFGSQLETLKEKVKTEEEAKRMYLGITRFLVEDSSFPGQTKSRTALQKECKARAYEVILRSNAWSGLIAEQFPEAVRLSIHPQTCGSEKIGIRLVGMESWMTPWHGVAVKKGEEFTLLKKRDAEAIGAQLVFTNDGRASHYEVLP